MNDKPLLLSIVELGGYPDFTALYEQCGFRVLKANTMRKALSLLKKQPPAVIVAEFIYGPTYGSQLSNFESLFGALQRDAPAAHLIALMDKANGQHFDRLKSRFAAHRAFYFPVNQDELGRHLESLV
ncbi:MAG: hypothetical protein LJE85_13895 [Gammaproteobacteria bacterium]|jgi:hypothetical protein|nr:hypothetical protein [Gammaproteobacteria bacterium]